MTELFIGAEQYDQLQQSVARLACAAYWRGRLETDGLPSLIIEQRLKEIVERNCNTWLEAARGHLELGGIQTNRSGADRRTP